MKINLRILIKIITIIIVGFWFAGCKNNSKIVPEAEYASKIVGHWQGTVGSSKETMYLNPDSTFVCKIHPMGFMANTLSQSQPGTVSGKWKIAGAIISMTITDSKNEHLGNSNVSSTIISFRENELTLKSGRNETSTFKRLAN